MQKLWIVMISILWLILDLPEMGRVFADAVYDPITNTITLSHVLAGDGSNQTESIYATNVKITASEILSEGLSWPPFIHPSPWPAEIDYFDMKNQELTISYITTPDQSIERRNIVIKIGSVLSFDYSESIAAGISDFKFRYVLDESLPVDWRNEFEQIMANLQRDIPILAVPSWYSIPIFAWKSDAETPLPFVRGACICGGGEGGSFTWMSLEISAWEFENNDVHRYSVVPHEYFHVWQKSHAPDVMEIKWLSEGAAATLESMYVQENYGYDYFSSAQESNLSNQVIKTPSLYESYDASGGDLDVNYSGSVFLILVLAEELKSKGATEAQAFRKILKDFYLLKPDSKNWKNKFEELFMISTDSFYEAVRGYNVSFKGLLPSPGLKLSEIFSN